MTCHFGDLYAQYYDLLYSDKDYNAESHYIDDLIRLHAPNARTVLDMGCGTGKHAELLCEKGYSIHGIDISYEMLKVAKTRTNGKEDKLYFSQSDIKTLHLGQRFDVVTSLFHVMSYQTSAEALYKAFTVAKEHLCEDGIFIFDFWYGPAVLTDPPVIRVKHLENEVTKVTRIAEPILHIKQNVVDVHYDIFIENKATAMIIEKKELHPMRYFFDIELDIICDTLGFKVINKLEWMKQSSPNLHSWNVVWILQK